MSTFLFFLLATSFLRMDIRSSTTISSFDVEKCPETEVFISSHLFPFILTRTVCPAGVDCCAHLLTAAVSARVVGEHAEVVRVAALLRRVVSEPVRDGLLLVDADVEEDWRDVEGRGGEGAGRGRREHPGRHRQQHPVKM